MQNWNILKKNESGFTLIELLVVLAIAAVLFGLSTINLGKAQTTASISTTTDTLLADIRGQQLLAMEGESGIQISAQDHGIYFQSNSYTLFASNTYNLSDTNNFNQNTDPVTLSTTFPSSQVIFSKGSGEVNGFIGGSNSITVSGNGNSQTITINRYGSTTVN